MTKQQAEELVSAIYAREFDGLISDAECKETIIALGALVARDASVRTLDNWTSEKPAREVWQARFGFTDEAERDFVISVSDEHGVEREFDGPSFPAARAKAAAWVREQGGSR